MLTLVVGLPCFVRRLKERFCRGFTRVSAGRRRGYEALGSACLLLRASRLMLCEVWTRMRYLVAAVGVVAAYAFLAPFGYLAFAIYTLLPTRDPDARARRLQRVMGFAFGRMHDFLRWGRLVDFDPRKVDGRVPDEPCVLVANHPTLTDVSAIIASIGEVATAVKPSVYRSFMAHPLLAASAQFEGVGAAGVSRVIDDAIDRLSRGFRVLVFPEGTRSPARGLGPFARVPFEVACRARVPVVPIAIFADPPWLTKQRGFWDPPPSLPRLRVRVLTPVYPKDYAFSSRTLRSVVDAQLRSELEIEPESPLGVAESHDGIAGTSVEEAHRRVADA